MKALFDPLLLDDNGLPVTNWDLTNPPTGLKWSIDEANVVIKSLKEYI
jgi:hypothetical protein